MQKLFLLIVSVFIFCTEGFSQLPTGHPTQLTNKWYNAPYLSLDSSARFAVRDTSWKPNSAGWTVFWQHSGVDSAMWIYDGVKWTKCINTPPPATGTTLPFPQVAIGSGTPNLTSYSNLVYKSGTFLGVNNYNPSYNLDVIGNIKFHNPSYGTLTLDSMDIYDELANGGGLVHIIRPINAGYTRTIVIDQPNTQMYITNGNTDSKGVGFARTGNNLSEGRFFAGSTADNNGAARRGYFTFYGGDASNNLVEIAQFDTSAVKFFNLPSNLTTYGMYFNPSTHDISYSATPWNLSGTSLYPSSTTYKVGIGTISPAAILDVIGPTSLLGNSSKMAFDGDRIVLRDTMAYPNILIGYGTGGSLAGISNVAIAPLAMNNSTGDNNIAIGRVSLQSSGNVNRNVAIGPSAFTLSNGSDGVAIGYLAGAAAFGDSNVVVGSFAAASKTINTYTIDNTEIVASTSTISGTGTASVISDNSLVGGTHYPIFIIFNDTPPSNVDTSGKFYANATVVNSNTLQFDKAAFADQGSGNFTLYLYNKQSNAIAIGYGSSTDSSNQISFGNSANTVLKANKIVIDISAVPQNGDTYIYNSSTGKLEPTTISNMPFKVKNMTTTQRDALSSVPQGTIILNTTTGTGQMYQGSTWHDLF